ncbi:MAG: response regulator [Pyrinomonadaceae bacterium]|nr:response regulator [Pyrinomonadaceae bacterium]
MLAYQDADEEIISEKLDRLEAETASVERSVETLKILGIGALNLKQFKKGFDFLQEASNLDPNDVVLSSHVNSLAIRLSEIESKDTQTISIPENKTILVVDDSATVRKLVSGKLEKCGLDVICAVDGMDALEKINESIPDLILLDITMPRMDGYQVCKLIRGNEATKDVPVVMISGKDGFFDKVRGRMAGTTGYITKPFGPETLMKTVEAYIE